VKCAWWESHGIATEGYAIEKISNVLLVFWRQVVEVFGFLNLYLEWKYKRIRYVMYLGRQSFYLKIGFVG